MKKKMLVTALIALIGLLAATGLFLASCEPGENCIGNGECIVTIKQEVGLSVDNEATRSSCGDKASWSHETNSYTGGCRVQNQIDGHNRTHGTHRCNC